MRRKLKNLKNKQGHSDNGAPKQVIDEAVYRERRNTWGRRYASQHSGWSHATRPRDQAISLRGITGITA